MLVRKRKELSSIKTIGEDRFGDFFKIFEKFKFIFKANIEANKN